MSSRTAGQRSSRRGGGVARDGSKAVLLNPLRRGERCGGVSALSHGARTRSTWPAVIALTCLAPHPGPAQRPLLCIGLCCSIVQSCRPPPAAILHACVHCARAAFAALPADRPTTGGAALNLEARPHKAGGVPQHAPSLCLCQHHGRLIPLYLTFAVAFALTNRSARKSLCSVLPDRNIPAASHQHQRHTDCPAKDACPSISLACV